MTRKEIEIQILKKAEKMFYDRRLYIYKHDETITYANCWGLIEAENLIHNLRKKLK